MKIWDLYREGMDNAFFLSKDSPNSTSYPLPTGSTEYENINSKRRGGAKVKVHGRKNARNKKAKHAG